MTARYYYRSLYPGLGDAQSDCLASLSALPANYVFRGSSLRYTAQVSDPNQSGFGSRDLNPVAGSLQARGYYNVSVSGGGGLSTGSYGVSITLSTPTDRTSSNDVSGDVYQALIDNGYVVHSDNVQIVSAPSASELCAGQVVAGQPTAPPGTGPALPPSSADTPSWLKDLELTLGIGSTGILIGGAVVAFLLLRK